MSTTAQAKPKTKKTVAAKKPLSHPSFAEMITDAIVSLKERTGSSQYAITKFIEGKQKELPPSFKKLVLNYLKKAVAAGKLVKVKNSFKVAPTRKAPAKTTTTTSTAAAKKPKPKTVAKPTAKAAPKPKVKAVAKPTVKAAAKPKAKTVKAAPVKKAAAKPVKKATAKPVKKAVAKPAKKVVAKPAKKVPVKSVKKPKSVKSPAKKARK